jgi:hypothetical protein
MKYFAPINFLKIAQGFEEWDDLPTHYLRFSNPKTRPDLSRMFKNEQLFEILFVVFSIHPNDENR